MVKLHKTEARSVTGEKLYIPPRPAESHKGDYGKILLLGGSVGYTGAPCLCALGALRGGAGLVYLGVPEEIYPILAARAPAEAMPFPRTEASLQARLVAADVCACGPGMGRSEGTLAAVRAVLTGTSGPVVLDADALWAFRALDGAVQRTASAVVLTPHEGEFALLLNRPVQNRETDALAYAREHNAVVVLKGHRTLCAFPTGELYRVEAGNPGMATGGSGDVLTGVMAALLARFEPEAAVLTAVWLHADAGDICAQTIGETGMTASDIAAALPAAERRLQENYFKLF